MSKSELQHRDDIVNIGRMMFDKGWVASNDGNITIRLDDARILATPAGVSKGTLKPDDLVVCDKCGRALEGTRQPTSEILMHVTIYDERPSVCKILEPGSPACRSARRERGIEQNRQSTGRVARDRGRSSAGSRGRIGRSR